MAAPSQQPENILGHAILHARDEGVYTDAYTNDTPAGMAAKVCSTWRYFDVFDLRQSSDRAKQAGNARRDCGGFSRSRWGKSWSCHRQRLDSSSDDSVETLEDEAVIYLGTIEHAEELEDDDLEDGDDEDSKDEREDPVGAQTVAHADGETIKDIYDAMSEDQKNVLHYMLGVALENAGVAHSDDDDNNIEHQEGRY